MYMSLRTYRERNVLSLIILVLSVFCIYGCSESSSSSKNIGFYHKPSGLFSNNSIVVDGVTRSYDFYVPSSLGGVKVPLVFLLHGGGSKPDDLTGESGFKAPYKIWMDIADSEKIIIVYPEGSTNPLGTLGWNDCRADAFNNPSSDDVGFIDALIDYFSNLFNIDSDRIYVSGTSNGGHMAIRLALELSDKIAAVAPVVAAMPQDACHDLNMPTSILFMNGTDDPILPFNGGEVAPDTGGRGTVLSAQESVDIWAEFNKTDSTPVIIDLPDVNKGDNSVVKKITYNNGVEGTQVILYQVSGGGHVEPSIKEQYSIFLELSLGKQNHDIEMANEIWTFFKDKTL